jgi:hypothetical protein
MLFKISNTYLLFYLGLGDDEDDDGRRLAELVVFMDVSNNACYP